MKAREGAIKVAAPLATREQSGINGERIRDPVSVGLVVVSDADGRAPRALNHAMPRPRWPGPVLQSGARSGPTGLA